MGIVFRQSVKSTIVIFFGAFLGAVTNFLYAFALSKTELGFFTNIIFLGAVAQIFAMMGTGSVLAIFTQKYPENDERRKVLVAIGMLVTFVTTILLSLVYILFKENIIELYRPHDQVYVREYFYWLPVLVLLWGFMSLFEHYLISQTKVAMSAFTKEVLIRIFNLLFLILLFYGIINFKVFIIANILVYLVAACILFFVSLRTKGFGFSMNWHVFSKAEYKEIIHFAWYHLLLVASVSLMGYIDTLMLGPLDKNGMETVAAYRQAILIISIAVIPYRAMVSASYATLNQSYIDKDMEKLGDLFSRARINTFVVSIGMFLAIACSLDNIVAILPQGYESVKPIVLILMAGKLIDVATGLSNELISISQFYKFNFRLSILLIVMIIVFNKLLIPTYSYYGAAWGATLALGIFSLLKMIFIWYKMGFHPFTKSNLYVLLIAIPAGLLGYFFPQISLKGLPYPDILNPALDAIVRSAVILILYLFLIIWTKPSKDINSYFKALISTKRLY